MLKLIALTLLATVELAVVVFLSYAAWSEKTGEFALPGVVFGLAFGLTVSELQASIAHWRRHFRPTQAKGR